MPAQQARDDRRLKLQQFLVMKAFNLRRQKQTLFQQFGALRRRARSSQVSCLQCIMVNFEWELIAQMQNPDAWEEFIDLDELCAYLSVPPFRRLVLVEVFGLSPPLETRIDFNKFVRFIQSGATQAAKEERELQRQPRELPIPPPRTYNQAVDAMVCFQPTLLSSQPRFSHPPPAPGLWKKREITVQERTTEYTKIDDQGRPQRLVEKERHQTEVIHMESLSGEFAHREITQFEQTEHLNDEMVHFDSGREEFLHLKSQHDEVSRFESTTPGAGAGNPGDGHRPEECEQPPPSPSIKRDPSAFAGFSGEGEAPAEYSEVQGSDMSGNYNDNNNSNQTPVPRYEEGWQEQQPIDSM